MGGQGTSRSRRLKQKEAILLGTGGDNSNWASGYFFEGVMTRGMPSAEAMRAVQRNIVAAGYAGHLQSYHCGRDTQLKTLWSRRLYCLEAAEED